jgi:hypothetical protein
VTGTAWDAAGNSSSATVSGINVDTTPPSIKGSATTADGKSYSGAWTNQSVTVRFTCADQPDLSGIKSCPAPVTVSTEGANQQVRGTAGDVAGNSSSTAVGDINIDLTKPIVTYTGNAGSYTVDQTIAITCAASDSVHNGVSSGLASTTCQNVHAPAYTFTLGSHTFSATATDKAGNAGSGSTSFVVKDTVAGLSTLTKEYVTNQQIANSLCTLLSQQKYAGYIALVQSYSHDSQLITPAHAALLIQLAQAL